MRKFLLAFLGLLVATVIAFLVNVQSANNDHITLIKQLTSPQGIWISVIIIVAGLVVGAFIQVFISRSQSSPAAIGDPEKTTTIRGSNLFFSTTKVKGKGSHLDKTNAVGSNTEIEP